MEVEDDYGDSESENWESEDSSESSWDGNVSHSLSSNPSDGEIQVDSEDEEMESEGEEIEVEDVSSDKEYIEAKESQQGVRGLGEDW